MNFKDKKISLTRKVKDKCEPIVYSKGFELADVEFEHEDDWGDSLVVFIYREQGVGIDDCEDISKAIEPVIDEIDPYNDSYCIIVSSLGIDRPFKNKRDYERYLNKEIEIKFYKAIDLSEFISEKQSSVLSEEISQNSKLKKIKKSQKRKNVSPKEACGMLLGLDDVKIDILFQDLKHSVPFEMIALARPKVVLESK